MLLMINAEFISESEKTAFREIAFSQFGRERPRVGGFFMRYCHC